MSIASKHCDAFWIVFVDGGRRFPVHYYQTSDMYTVELPAGTYEGRRQSDLMASLKADFDGWRMSK